ncbi:phosphatase PAP2 family protein [Nocardia neocaledoniensis]|uniref:phosphatase PAP2 family protein n=1 Tax=Nocardia neocaledoniensis TaxID=236511 RepID=UPI0024576C67|nr:phosphatase PAP2 family protein [Nocardia neocaledoniensis]
MFDEAPARAVTLARATAIGVGAAVTVALPLTFPDDGGPSALDTAVAEPVASALSPGAAEVLVAPSDGPVVLLLLLCGCAWFAARREWRRAVTMLVVPEVILAVNTWLLKPLWDRRIEDYLAYPSGHTVHLVAVATTFACLVTSTTARIVVAALTVLAVLVITPGMVELGYHHPTDVLGGAAAAAAMAIGLCLLARPRTRSGDD